MIDPFAIEAAVSALAEDGRDREAWYLRGVWDRLTGCPLDEDSADEETNGANAAPYRRGFSDPSPFPVR